MRKSKGKGLATEAARNHPVSLQNSVVQGSPLFWAEQQTSRLRGVFNTFFHSFSDKTSIPSTFSNPDEENKFHSAAAGMQAPDPDAKRRNVERALQAAKVAESAESGE